MTEILTKPAISIDVDVVLDIVPYEETDDPNHKTHIVNPPANLHIWQPGMSSQDIVNIARLLTKRVTALCGHTWVPAHNPDKFDICERCMQIAHDLISKDEG